MPYISYVSIVCTVYDVVWMIDGFVAGYDINTGTIVVDVDADARYYIDSDLSRRRRYAGSKSFGPNNAYSLDVSCTASLSGLVHSLYLYYGQSCIARETAQSTMAGSIYRLEGTDSQYTLRIIYQGCDYVYAQYCEYVYKIRVVLA